MGTTITITGMLLLLAIIAGTTNVGLIVRYNRQNEEVLRVGRRNWGSVAPFLTIATIGGIAEFVTLAAMFYEPFVNYMNGLPGAATATITAEQTAVGIFIAISIAIGYLMYRLARLAEGIHRGIIRGRIEAIKIFQLQTAKDIRRAGGKIIDFSDHDIS